jgi:Flp pilus assembly protein TadD
MVAMVSPKGQGIRKPFNWGRVIRHELVHIFNLEQTNFQVPHWLTEGLAVRNEGFARPPDWLHLLAERAGAEELLNLNTINLGFMRPRSPAEWTLAYCQAQLYVEYLTKAHGEAAVAGLLAAYRDGLDTPAALKRACGVEVLAFEAKYKEYVREVVARSRGKPPEKPLTLAQLQESAERAPDDLDLAARLAEQYWKRRRSADARTIVERILQKQPKHGLALFVKAQLLLSAGEDEHAQQLLEMAAALDPPEPKVLRALGKQHFDAAKMDLAEAMYQRGQQAEPNDPSWLEDLARVYKQTGATDKRIAALEQLAPLDADDLPMRRELAERLAEAGRWADAERWSREALEIDVEDSPARTVLFRALAAQGKQSDADRLRKLLNEP